MPSFLTPMFEFLNTDSLGNFKLIILGYIALLWISIIIWVTRDALSRSSNLFFQAFAILLTIAIPILGVLLYLIIRPSKTLMERYYEQLEAGVLEGEEKELESQTPNCERCFTELEEDYAFCPNCAFQLKKICPGCKKAFDNQWNMCPYCGKLHKAKVANGRPSKKNNTKSNEEEMESEILNNDEN